MKHLLKIKEYTVEKDQDVWQLMHSDVRYYTYIQYNDIQQEPPSYRPTPPENLRLYSIEIPLEAKEKLPDPRINRGRYLNIHPEPSIISFGEEPDFTATLEPLDEPKTPPPKRQKLEEDPQEDQTIQDTIDIFLDEWLTIDQIGTTASPTDLLPPTDLQDTDIFDLLNI